MRLSKRLFDLLASAVGLLLLVPLFALIALLIKLDDGGPVFFRQERVGYRGRPFLMWKFRTMFPGAEKSGGQLTFAGDKRITRAGQFLRRGKLDELPQLINVLRGEMSLVGPRPEVARYVACYSEEQRLVLEQVPGITDPASLKYRHENELLAGSPDPEKLYLDEIMPDKIRRNLEYATRATLVSDIVIILRTLFQRDAPRRYDREVPGTGGRDIRL